MTVFEKGRLFEEDRGYMNHLRGHGRVVNQSVLWLKRPLTNYAGDENLVRDVKAEEVGELPSRRKVTLY